MQTVQRRSLRRHAKTAPSWIPPPIRTILYGAINPDQVGRLIGLNTKITPGTITSHQQQQPPLIVLPPSASPHPTVLATVQPPPQVQGLEVPPSPSTTGGSSSQTGTLKKQVNTLSKQGTLNKQGGTLQKQQPGTLTRPPGFLTITPITTGRRDNSRYQTTGFIGNRITSARYNAATFLPKQLFAQFSKLANVYFLLIAGLQQVEGWSPTGQYTTLLPLVMFVGLAMMREAYDDRMRHKRDEAENKDLAEVLVGNMSAGVPAHWEYKQWELVQVGDIVRVRKDKAVPADIILLRTALDQGLCYIQTSQLDGESNLKQRSAIPQTHAQLNTLEDVASFKGVLEAEDPNEDIYNFDGSITLSDNSKVPLTIVNMLLRGTTLRNTPEAIGVVVFTGEETKIRMNANRNKRTKSPHMEKQTNQVVVIIFAVVILMSIFTTVQSIAWEAKPRWFINSFAKPESPAAVFFTCVILYNTMIPISLYVTLEIVKLIQAAFINNDILMYHEPTDQPAEARTASLNEELGQVSYLFTDKTGTLTENQMLFRQMSVAGIAFLHATEQEEMDAVLLAANGNDIGRVSGGIGDQTHDNLGENALETAESITQLFLTRPSTAATNVMSVVSGGDDGSFASPTTSDANVPSEREDPHSQRIRCSHSDQGAAPRTTKDLTRHLLENPGHPLTSKIHLFLQVIALCHQAMPDNDPALSGTKHSSLNTVDGTGSPAGTTLRTARVTDSGNIIPGQDGAQLPSTPSSLDNSRFRSIVYQAASPDEVALVTAVREFGYTLISRTTTNMTLVIPNLNQDQTSDSSTSSRRLKYEILDTIEFTSSRKRMSIVLRFPDGRIALFAKGADNAMLERSKPIQDYSLEEQDVYNATVQHLERFATAGLRTLVYAVRYLSESEYARWSRLYLDASTSVTNRIKKLADAADMIEKNWTIIGATGVEDRLQKGVSQTIRMLERANIKVWMVTGDKKQTSISIGYASGLARDTSRLLQLDGVGPDGLELTDAALLEQVRKLQAEISAWEAANGARARAFSRKPSANTQDSSNAINIVPTATQATIEQQQNNRRTAVGDVTPAPGSNSNNPFVLVVDGPTIARVYETQGELFQECMRLACSATTVLCCRVSPLQKSLVVRSVRDYLPSVVTAAIGDGANDIAMIQQAHVGIGIVGREGMQAARSSDYSIARFQFLNRLLLVHGHWAYIRVAKFTLGTFYKCIMFYCTQLYFQLHSGYSGTSLYEQWTLTMYNIIFSSLPVILLGIFDRDLPCRVLTEFPELYRVGQRNGEFNTRIFLLWLVKSIAQTIIVMLTTIHLHANRFPSDPKWQDNLRVDIGPADSYATLYTMGTIAYTSVVLTATIQICYISPSTITMPLHICAALTIGVWFLWQAVYSVVWPMFGLRTGYEQAGIFGQIMGATISSIVNRTLNEASLWWAVVGLATTLGVAPEWAFYKIRRYYFPTDAEKLRELDVLRERYAEQRKRLAPLVDESPNPAGGNQVSPSGKAGREASLKPKRRNSQSDLEMGARTTTLMPLATRSANSSTVPSSPTPSAEGKIVSQATHLGTGSARAQPGLDA